MDKETEQAISSMAKEKISSYDSMAEISAEVDKRRDSEGVTDENTALVPFQTFVPDQYFFKPQHGEDAYGAIDVCKFREGLVRPIAPLESVTRARISEFTPMQWRQHQDNLFYETDKLMDDSESLRNHCLEKWSSIDATTTNMQQDTTRRLDQRVKRTIEAKELLTLQIDACTEELHWLTAMKSRLEKAQFTLELPERNNAECLHIRLLRRGIDNTRDEVSKMLQKELKTLQTGRSLLNKSLHEIETALSRLMEIKLLLEHDWSDKVEAMQTDHSAAKLQINPVPAQYKPISAALNEGASTTECWQSHIYELRAISEREIIQDTKLRRASDQAIIQVSQDASIVGSEVDSALNANMSKIETALLSLREEDGKLRRELSNQELNIYKLVAELQKKETPMQVAQTRHTERSYRPGADRCLDQPHYSLISELEKLPKNISSLRQLLGKAEEYLEILHRQHETLIKNILEREHALNLETRCVIVRKCKSDAAKFQ